MNRWQWALRLLTRRMWFRAALFCLFAMAIPLASAPLGRLVSYGFAASIGAKSVDSILNVLASSMLAVTTFSLTAMVSAYSGAASNITPRAVQLLVDDSTAQNALSTFLGSFLFSIVGIIALSTGIYDETGRVILYAGTILVIVVIVVTFLRWIQHITRFGLMSDTIDRVEEAAQRAVQAMVSPPRFGPQRSGDIPDDACRVDHPRIGRITHIDVPALEALSCDIEAKIVLEALPGTLVDPGRTIAWTNTALDPDQVERVRDAFTIAHDRAFDNDPRFGLVVLSEIASRALSPAVNDPGTAIAVIEAGTRVLTAMLRHAVSLEDDTGKNGDGETGQRGGANPASPSRDEPTGCVVVPAFDFRDLLEDLYRPIARDGAGTVEVAVRLQKAYGALKAVEPRAERDCAHVAQASLKRALDAMGSDADRHVVSAVHALRWP